MNTGSPTRKLPAFMRFAELMSSLLPQSVKQSIYRQPFLSSMIRSRLNSFAPTGLTEVVVSGGILRGARLKLDLKSEKYYWLGTYEPQLVSGFHQFCKSGKVVYDVGANIGYTALAFSRLLGPDGKVFAFEPLPDNAKRVQENVSLNQLGSAIQLVPCAVSDCEGQESFMVHDEHAMGKLVGSKGRDIEYSVRLEVPSLRLDDFVYRDGNPCPDIVKIDIEGGGVKAIPGMLRLLSEGRPVVLMEWHGPEERQVAWAALSKNQYRVYKMKKGYPEVIGLEGLEWKEYVVAVPPHPEEGRSVISNDYS